VVISIVSHKQLTDQYKIISAIKEAGNVKVPSNLVLLFFSMFAPKYAISCKSRWCLWICDWKFHETVIVTANDDMIMKFMNIKIYI